MEEQKELKLNDERALYLLKHFEELDHKGRIHFQNLGFEVEQINQALQTIGSKFYARFCDNPFDLIYKLSHYTPFNIKQQTNGNKAILYKIPFTGGIGNNRVMPLKEILEFDKAQIKKVLRNGYPVNVLEGTVSDCTNQLVVICNSENEVITIFPGIYAPSFPPQLTNEEDVKASIIFWENHVFINNSPL